MIATHRRFRNERRFARPTRPGVVIAAVVALLVAAAPGAGAQEPSPSGSPSPSPAASPSPTSSASPSPSGSPSPSPSGGEPSPEPSPVEEGPAIALLNPSAGYDPGLDPTVADDPPKISDRFDGLDDLYHVVAWVGDVPPNAFVEASLQYPDENELTIGMLKRANPTADTWEMFWDVPETLPEGSAVMKARLYELTADGFVERAADEVDVEMRHKAPDIPLNGEQAADETVAITWPSQTGGLGFYKPRGGKWQTALDGSASAGTQWVDAFYSVSPPGTPPAFVDCGSYDAVPAGGPAPPPIPFQIDCALGADELPGDVTAVALVAEGTPDASVQNQFRTQEAADVERITPYVQTPDEMNIVVTPFSRAVMPALSPTHSGCLGFFALVTDALARPVQGANLDVHVTGPDDNVGFAIAGGTSSDQRAPDQGGHSIESAYTCTGGTAGEQATHRVPGGIDTIHRESTQGSGISGPQDVRPGEWRFHIYSETPGFADITVWVDDEPLADITKTRPLDSDTLDAGEASATAVGQWYPALPRVTIDPPGSTAGAGICTPYTIKVAAGTDPLPGANVDVHATGPTDDLDFCDPIGATPRRAPDADPAEPATPHEDEDAGESSHAGTFNQQTQTTGFRTQHTEGETDEFGDFVVGLMSPVRGDTTIVAWFDGEKTTDNDEQKSGEALASATTSWVASAVEDAGLSFVNPSPYGAAGTGGAGNGTQLPDSGGEVRILTRVDSPSEVPGVELFISADQKKTFTLLGDMTRVDNTDLYELLWPVARADGNYSLRAIIEGTAVIEDIDVKIGAGDRLPMVPNPPYETLELTTPQPAEQVAFDDGSTTLTGVATAGAEGVDIFYTKVGANVTPKAADWIFCGYVDLSGLGSTPQDFEGKCKLVGADQGNQVSGIAAITFDCGVPGCDANPTPPSPNPGIPVPRADGQKETGDAARIFGFDAHPLFALEPAEAAADVGTCEPMSVVLTDQNGQPMAHQPVDVVLTPNGHASLCDLGDSTWTFAMDESHIEATTPANGQLAFGVSSDAPVDSNLSAWLDRSENDTLDSDEFSDISLLHWSAPHDCTIVGTAGADVLKGTPVADRICGLEGKDVVKGRGAGDVLFGGSGRDELYGGRGADTLKGGSGDDELHGGRGTDTCRPGAGKDRTVGCEQGPAGEKGAGATTFI